MRVFVPTGDQAGFARFAQDYTTTTLLLAQLILKPNSFVCSPKFATIVSAFGNHSAVGRPANIGPQLVVPGK